MPTGFTAVPISGVGVGMDARSAVALWCYIPLAVIGGHEGKPSGFLTSKDRGKIPLPNPGDRALTHCCVLRFILVYSTPLLLPFNLTDCTYMCS